MQVGTIIGKQFLIKMPWNLSCIEQQHNKTVYWGGIIITFIVLLLLPLGDSFPLLLASYS